VTKKFHQGEGYVWRWPWQKLRQQLKIGKMHSAAGCRLCRRAKHVLLMFYMINIIASNYDVFSQTDIYLACLQTPAMTKTKALRI